MKQMNQTDNNMTHKKSKSKRDSKNALANMGANMSVMLAGDSPLATPLSNDAEDIVIGAVEMSQPPVPANPLVKSPIQDAQVQSVEYNEVSETEAHSMQEGVSEMDTSTPVVVNIDIEKTQGNAIYSSLLELQNTLDNFQLDIKQESLREVVHEAIKAAVEEHLEEEDKVQQEKVDKLRSEGQPGTVLEAYQLATQRNTDAINNFNKNSKIIQTQYKNIVDCLRELLGRTNLYPYEKPKFKDDNGHILLQSLYLYPLYYFKRFYSSKHIQSFFKFVAWSIWLAAMGLLFFIARDNAILRKQENINRYIHAYFCDNAEVMMELEGIDLMFSNHEAMPVPIREYREYMTRRKKETKAKDNKQK